LARKVSPSACMFCEMGDCEEHAPKPAPVKKNRDAPVSRKRAVAASGGQVCPPSSSAPDSKADPQPLPSVQELQKQDSDGDEVMREAALCLLRGGLLDIDEVKSRRIFMGRDAEPYIKAHDWKKKVGHGSV